MERHRADLCVGADCGLTVFSEDMDAWKQGEAPVVHEKKQKGSHLVISIDVHQK